MNPPNLIEEHSLRFLHSSHEANKMKTFPTYNYNIPEKFDLDFSDKGNLIYITAEDKNLPADSNSVILVYKVGVPLSPPFMMSIISTKIKKISLLMSQGSSKTMSQWQLVQRCTCLGNTSSLFWCSKTAKASSIST